MGCRAASLLSHPAPRVASDGRLSGSLFTTFVPILLRPAALIERGLQRVQPIELVRVIDADHIREIAQSFCGLKHGQARSALRQM
jgi:hypothetical protein